MEVFETMRGRRSIRSFKSTPVNEKDLEKILDAGISAPSAGNGQPWEFIIVRDVEIKQKLATAAHNQKSLNEAPVVIVVCADVKRTSTRYKERGRDLYCIQDTAAATQNIHLAAYALGYGTCWVGSFDEGAVAGVVKAPSGVRPLAMIPLGVPNEKPNPPSKLPLSDVTHQNHL